VNIFNGVAIHSQSIEGRFCSQFLCLHATVNGPPEAVDGAVGAQNPAGEAFPAGIDLPNAEKPPISERLQTNW